MLLIGRFVRFLIAVVFFAFGYAVAQFANGNRETITISVSPYSFQVPVYLLALVPLAVGLALGWLYAVPARTHEFADHWRSWRSLRRMEKENKDLRRSLDKVLELPEDAAEAPPHPERLALEPKPVAVAPPAPPAAESVVVREVEPAAGPAKGAARPVNAARTARKPSRPRASAANGRARAHPLAQPEAAPAS